MPSFSAVDLSSASSTFFQLVQSVSIATNGEYFARLGNLKLPQRTPMHTPNYVAITSRGAVSHLSQDMMRDQTLISGVYVALEDC